MAGNKIRLKRNHWYRMNDRGQEFIGQYTGCDQAFGCCVCDKGHRAKTFNIWYCEEDYETWGFGPCHMPEILEDLGDPDNVIVNK